VAGGFNSRVDTAVLTGTPYAPEKVAAWEIGLKSDWYDHRLRVNLAAFSNKYSQLQVGAFIPGGGLQQTIVNNAYERAQGVEAELFAIPIDHLNLQASIGYLDAHYTSFFADVFGTGPADYSFLRVGYAPKWTTRLEAYYDIDLNGYGTLTPDVSWNHSSSYFTDLTNSPVGFQKSYGIWDASLTYVEPSNRWKLSLWGKNLNNELRRLSAVPSSGYFTQLYFADPLTFGVDASIKVDDIQL
jgi:iron complex outermembrane recepter protein